jgi:hypothetical protein
MRPRLASILALLAFLAGCGGHTARLEVALQDNAVFLHRYYYDRDLAFRQARELGVSWLRVTLIWSLVERAPGRYDWSRYDSLVRASRLHGLHVELTVAGPAPGWATGDRRVGVFRPDAARFAELARAAAAHFRGRVERYSIWNEPNYASWLTPQSDAATIYRRLYTGAYAAICAADSAAKILIGETAGPAQPGLVTPAPHFIRAVACRDDNYRPVARCAPLVTDGYAHHPYDFLHPPDHAFPSPDAVTLGSLDRLTATLDRLRAVHALAAPGGGVVDLYLTEFGYMSQQRGGPPDPVRARYLTDAFDIAVAHYPRVRQLLQYLLVDPPPTLPGGSFDTGLIADSGAESASFHALAQWAAQAERDHRIESP